MFLELLATIFAGIAVAGIVMLINRATGGRLPRWLAPVAAGAAMIAVTISSEYSWFARTSAALPEGVKVAHAVENRSFYRPWTYVAPYVERFVAVDTATIRRNPNLPDQRLTDLYFFGRWSALQKLAVVMDCKSARRATLTGTVEFDDDGRIKGADWSDIAPDDPVLETVCAEGG